MTKFNARCSLDCGCNDAAAERCANESVQKTIRAEQEKRREFIQQFAIHNYDARRYNTIAETIRAAGEIFDAIELADMSPKA